MGVSNLTISVDTANRTVIRSALPQPDLVEPYYSVDIPSGLVRELILRDMSWEELALSFRLRLTCRPNLHDQLVEMFLIAGPNNIGKILMDFESQHHADDKIIISCGGNKYKIDKYCPHQGTNLEYGWEDSGFAPSIAGDLTLMMAIAKMQIYESLRNESISQLESIRL